MRESRDVTDSEGEVPSIEKMIDQCGRSLGCHGGKAH